MIGSILGERYEILEKIGDGGMALVYRARDLQEKRTVAVKVLRSEYVSDEEFIRRFRREAEAMQRLQHPNMVEIYDISISEPPYYLVMEYVDGVTLDKLIAAEELSFERVLYLALQIADGLQYAHEHMIIHRDIKPQNILLTANGQVKITDFGIAVLVSTTTLVKTRSVVGTVHYLSPEQARGEPLTEQSDLYSFGVMLYEMITGQVPFDADNTVAIVYKHDQEEPAPLSELRQDIPGALEAVVMKLLEKDVRDRYRSSRELHDDLEDIIDILPESGSTLLEKMRRSMNKRERNRRDKRRSRSFLRGLLVFMLLVCLLAGLLYGAWNQLFTRKATALMPLLEGKQMNEAIAELSVLGFAYHIAEERFDPRIPEGVVIEQKTQAGVNAFTDTIVELVVSLGKQMFTLPDVVGLRNQQATLELQSKGLTVLTEPQSSTSIVEGLVMEMKPEARTMVTEGTEVTLVVSTGQEKVLMISVLGLSFEQASERLSELGLLPADPIIHVDASYPAARITGQSPLAGELVPKNSRVDLWINPAQRDDVEITITFPADIAIQVIRVEVEDASLTNPSRVIYNAQHKANDKPLPLSIPVEPPAVVRVYRNDILIFSGER
ncbi:MAG: protein kinase [Symbiobacteriaceae bacterium]|nr:protein kinase [Symbiobacteriaceae bacterium]